MGNRHTPNYNVNDFTRVIFVNKNKQLDDLIKAKEKLKQFQTALNLLAKGTKQLGVPVVS